LKNFHAVSFDRTTSSMLANIHAYVIRFTLLLWFLLTLSRWAKIIRKRKMNKKRKDKNWIEE